MPGAESEVPQTVVKGPENKVFHPYTRARGTPLLRRCVRLRQPEESMVDRLCRVADSVATAKAELGAMSGGQAGRCRVFDHPQR